jgi:hypothetical protein
VVRQASLVRGRGLARIAAQGGGSDQTIGFKSGFKP